MKTLLYIAMSAFVVVSPLYARTDSFREKAERERRERNARIEANNRERERVSQERNALISRFNDIAVDTDFNRTKNEMSLAAQAFKDGPTTEYVNFTNRITGIVRGYRAAYREASGYAANPDSAVPAEFLASVIRLEEVSGSLNRELDAFARLRDEQERTRRMAELDSAWKEETAKARTNSMIILSQIRKEEAKEQDAEREALHRRSIELLAVSHSNALARAKADAARAKAEEAATNARLAELDRKIKAEAEESARIREEKRQEEARATMEERQFQLELARIQSGRGGSSSTLLLSILLSAFVSLGIGCGVGFAVWGRRPRAD